MVDAHYRNKISRMEIRDGCPVAPGSSVNKTAILKPLAQVCSLERGIVLDASLSKVVY